jgi:hypothetical protein
LRSGEVDPRQMAEPSGFGKRMRALCDHGPATGGSRGAAGEERGKAKQAPAEHQQDAAGRGR